MNKFLLTIFILFIVYMFLKTDFINLMADVIVLLSKIIKYLITLIPTL